MTARVNAARLARLGVPVFVQAKTGPGVTVQGVRGRRAGLDDGTGYFEAVDLDAGSLPLTPAEGDRVTIDDVAYRVVDVGRSDPYGLTTLSLERQA